MRIIYLNFLFVCCSLNGIAQPKKYTAANAHSHNDYENISPFYSAYNNGFGSIEADIFLQDGKLIVAHDTRELTLNRTLEKMYLQPLDSALKSHHGYAYTDSTSVLQILIDVKTNARSTLDKLIETLRKYPGLIGASSLHWVISGNRPPQEEFLSYPLFIWFDGVISQSYDPAALKRIAMMSDNFRSYSYWDGQGKWPPEDSTKLQVAISKIHALGLPVRFWNAPDQPNAWNVFIHMKSDYINTDHIAELAAFLNGISAIGN